MRIIDADALLDRLEMLRWNYSLKAGYRDAMTDAIGEVSNALTIDAVPVVRHGRWIPNSIGDGICSDYWHTCSTCGYEHPDEYGQPTPYCPGCGAKMDVGKANEYTV